MTGDTPRDRARRVLKDNGLAQHPQHIAIEEAIIREIGEALRPAEGQLAAAQAKGKPRW